MIVDCNALFGFWPRRMLNADLESVREEAVSHGITTSLVCSIRGIFDSHTEGNDETIKECESDPALQPVGTLNPHRLLDLDGEIDRRLAQGIRMFRFFPEYQHWPYRFTPFYRILDRLDRSGAIIVCPARVGGHQNSGVITDIAWLASRYDLRFLITGVFYGNLAEAITAAQSEKNLFLETHLLNSPDGFEVLVEQVGAKRLIYGSAFPLHPINSSLLPLMYASLKEGDRKDILYGNIARELGWNQCE
ncbi:MAG TPA: hypothetical protein DDW87_04075 [Firmicutes bacterium]|nr:hypothetical protein [Bacillota bacterium]